jgi:hypothetical protein
VNNFGVIHDQDETTCDLDNVSDNILMPIYSKNFRKITLSFIASSEWKNFSKISLSFIASSESKSANQKTFCTFAQRTGSLHS